MPKIPIENQSQEEKEFSRKEIVTPEKTETLANLYQNKEFSQIQKPPRVSSKIIVLSIILSLIFGLLAGFFGALYLLTIKEIKIPFFKKINLEEILPKREITLFTEKKITILPEERISGVIEQISPQIVQVFFSKKIKETKKIFDDLILLPENLAYAVILTNDGWLATTKNVVSQPNLNLEVLTSERKRFRVKKIIIDDLSEVAFLKIETKGLPVVKFAESDSLTFGKNLLLFDNFFNFDLVQISQPPFSSGSAEKGIIRSTEKFINFIKINKELSENFLAAPVFDLEGAFVGFLSQKNKISPVSYFRPMMPLVFKEEKIKRPFLGLEYIDLKDLLVTSNSLANIKFGALVYAVKEKSPAFLAGLKKGDLILKINGLSLEVKKSLTEMIQEFQPNQEIEFLVLRDNKEITLKAKLDLLK